MSQGKDESEGGLIGFYPSRALGGFWKSVYRE